MAQLNGTVTKDAKLITAQSGKQFTTFDLVENVRYKDKDGKMVQKSFYYNCIYWNRAEKVAPYIKKGTILTVQCNVVARPYTDNNGNAKASITANVESLKFLGGRSKKAAIDQAQSAAAVNPNNTTTHEMEDDLPF